MADVLFTAEEKAKIEAAKKAQEEKEREQALKEAIIREQQKHLGCE